MREVSGTIQNHKRGTIPHFVVGFFSFIKKNALSYSAIPSCVCVFHVSPFSLNA